MLSLSLSLLWLFVSLLVLHRTLRWCAAHGGAGGG